MAIFAAIGMFQLRAGEITYVAVPSNQSDSNCGISRNHGYTTAVDGGNSRGTDRILNGISLFALSGAGQNTATADNCTLNALSGTLTDGGLTSKRIEADGTMRDVLSDMIFNNAGGDNSQIEIVLDPESLDQGATYDLRVYICSSSGQNRQVNLAFFGDGRNAAETGFFNEDDARTSAGRFQTTGQAYYINYRYTWDGDSTPGIIITQKFGGAPFCLYAMTNEQVSETDLGATSGATLQAGEGEGEPGLSTGFVEEESDQIGVESDDFYSSESLNSHGRWVKLAKWGTCWQPTDVPSGWSPYTNGTWKECEDCGWTFISDEPWAWACYHYGRWARVTSGCGWVWVPGTVWAPSWVSWRQGRDDSCIGWAPLPPEAGCRLGVGISSWVDAKCNIGPEYYTFINIRDFGSDSYFGCGCIYERTRNTNIIVDTFNITNICFNRRIPIYCGGPDFNWCNTRIRQLGGRELDRIHVNRYANFAELGGRFVSRQGDQLGLVSPRIRGTKHPKFRPHIAESVGADKIDHGWRGITDKKQEQQIRNHIAQETKGKNPRNSPAKLPDDVAQKIAQRQRGPNLPNAGQVGQGGSNLWPGGKRERAAQEAQATGGEAQSGAAAGNDQHPGKTRGRTQAQSAVGAGASTGQQGGPGMSRRHPGQSVGKQRSSQAAGAGADSAATQQGGSQHPGRKGRGQTAQEVNQQVGAGQTAGERAGSGEVSGTTGPGRVRRKEGQSSARHAQRQGGQGQAQVQGAGQGVPGQGRRRPQQLQQQQQQQQQFQQQRQRQRQQRQQQSQQQQQQQQQQGGGRRPHVTPTPPPG